MVRTLDFKSRSKVIKSPSINRYVKPERILDDPQAHVTRQRHQRLRVKLHAANWQRLVLDCHCDPVIGAGGDVEHVGHAIALDEQRMIAADHNLVRQAPHQPPTPHLHPRRPTMRRLSELTELAAKIFADRLHAKTYAENRQLLVERGADGI